MAIYAIFNVAIQNRKLADVRMRGFYVEKVYSKMAGEVVVDALPYFDQGYDDQGVREAVSKKYRQYPGNVPPPSKPEDSIFCKTVNFYGMKVNITI